jgi:hypothetical protein
MSLDVFRRLLRARIFLGLVEELCPVLLPYPVEAFLKPRIFNRNVELWELIFSINSPVDPTLFKDRQPFHKAFPPTAPLVK